MSHGYILSIDQGTTGSRAILYSGSGNQVVAAYKEFKQYYPKPGWVEHDPTEILESVQQVVKQVLKSQKITSSSIHAIGITNQRETVVFWDRATGKPLGKAIVWQDRRTDDICKNLKKRNFESKIRNKTGLVIDPYFSGTKIKWFLDHHPTLRKKAKNGDICYGTIDSWLLYHLTGKRIFATDFTNASRTLLFNLKTKLWDAELCKILSVPVEGLPEARPSNSLFGKTKKFAPLADGIPIHSILGDQQAALYGQGCYLAGEMKNTYGTGCFILINLGSKFVLSHAGLVTTIACDRIGNPAYALEGSIFIGGAAIQWLRDGLKVIKKASETERIALKSPSEHIVVVPAFTGLGAPYWRADVRGAIFGLTRGTSREMIIKATVDSIAFQVDEVLRLMQSESKTKVTSLKVDGGATRNNYLMQFQADLLNLDVLRSSFSESTAWGAAKLAGLASGFWPSVKKLDKLVKYDRFKPKMRSSDRKLRLLEWQQAVKKLLS